MNIPSFIIGVGCGLFIAFLFLFIYSKKLIHLLKNQIGQDQYELEKRSSELLSKEIKTIISPFEENLRSYQKSIEHYAFKYSEQSEGLKSQVLLLKESQDLLRGQTHSLVDALKGNQKVQGIWGELVLERVLEMSGLKKDREYTLQGAGLGIKSSEGQTLKPDLVVHLPDGKNVIVDSKVSLKSYLSYMESVSEDHLTADESHLKDFKLSLKRHIDGLSKKKYHESVEDGLDFVFLFIPIDHAYLLIGHHLVDLIDEAYSKNIILSCPTMLLTQLRSIKNLWKVDGQNKNAKNIAKKAGLFLDKLELLFRDLSAIDSDLLKAKERFDKVLARIRTGKGSLEDKARELQDLGLD